MQIIENIILQQKMKKPQAHSVQKANNKKLSERAYSLHYLYNLNAKLESQKQSSKKMLEKIKKEQTMSSKLNEAVNTSIAKIENEGANYAVRLEQQKRKNQALNALVHHYQGIIYAQKKCNTNEQSHDKKIPKIPVQGANIEFQPRQNYSESMADKDKDKQINMSKNQECAQKMKELKELEKQYQQFVLKTNNSEYQLSRKLDEVNTLRSERTIVTKVFDQFQHEIFQHELEYKQLVIERVALENKFEEGIREFEEMSNHAEKQYHKFKENLRKKSESSRLIDNSDGSVQKIFGDQSSIKKKTEKSEYIFAQNRHTFSSSDNKESANNLRLSLKQEREQRENIVRSRYLHNQKRSNCKSTFSKVTDIENKSEKQLNNLKYEKEVKEVFQDLGIKDQREICHIVDNLEKNVQDLFRESERLYDVLYQKEKNYCEMFKRINKNKKKQGYPEINNDLEDTRVMEDTVMKNSKLRLKIEDREQQKDNISEELMNFEQKELAKLSKFINFERISQNEAEKDETKAFNIENITNRMSEIQKKIFKLPNLSNEDEAHEVSIIKQIPTERANQQDLSSSNKNNEPQKKILKKKPSFFIKQKSQKNLGVKFPDTSETAVEIQKIGNRLGYLKTLKQWKSKSKQKNMQSIIEDQFDQSRLEMILKANRTTHNNTTIFTEQQLIQISRFKLDNSRKSQASGNQSILQDRTKQTKQKKSDGKQRLTETFQDLNNSNGSYRVYTMWSQEEKKKKKGNLKTYQH